MIKAKIVDNLDQAIRENFDDPAELDLYNYPEWKTFRDRIQGKVVDLFFIGKDAFEAIDGEWWLPNNCWTVIGEEKPKQAIISRAFADRLESWADKQFPQATQLSRANHLRAETGELIESLETGIGNVTEEVGDCMALLLHIISHGKIDIEVELERKLKINMERKWGEPNEKGFSEHVKAEPK